MSKFGLRRTALIAALMSAGIAFGTQAQAQATQPAAPKSSADATSQSKPPAVSPQPVPGTTGQSSTAPGTAPATPGPPSATTTQMGAPAASTTDRSAGKVTAALESKDRKFIEKAARDGMAEVELAKLAQEKARSDQVKQFAKRMADDHAKANAELKKIADAKGVTLPAEVDRGARRALDKLAKKSGADFDREYMDHMVSDHKKAVKEFKDEAKSGRDTHVKGFASSTLPTLEQHLEMAKSTEAAAKNAARTARETSAMAGKSPPASSTSGAQAPARTTQKSGASS
jgi:putative membrane protein